MPRRNPVLIRIVCLGSVALFTIAATARPTLAQTAATQPAGPGGTVPHDHGGPTDPHDHPPPTPTSAPTVVLKPGEVPGIEFVTPVFDFGRVKGGSVVKTEYVFTNPGNGTLEITAVRPSCGCTTSGEYDKIVPPGKTGKIPIELNTGKYNGRVTKTVTIETNCTGERHMLTLTIQGEVWQPIDIQPASAMFGRLEQQKEVEKIITLTGNLDAPLEITDLTSSNKIFTVEKREKTPGKVYEIVVKAVPPFAPGSNSGRITMKTNYPENPTPEFQALALIPEVIEVTPPNLGIPAGSRVPVKRQFYVRNNDPKPLKISDVKATQPGVRCTVTESQPGKVFQIVVDFPANFKPTVDGDRVSFKTDNSLIPVINVPIILQGGSGFGPVPGTGAPIRRPEPPKPAPTGGAATTAPAK